MNSSKQTPIAKRFWTPRRVTLTCLLFGLFALAASSCKSDDISQTAQMNGGAGAPKVSVTSQRGGQAGAQQTSAPQATSDVIAPDLMATEMEALDGKPFRLADYKDKIVVLDIWATWCGPCKMEIPHLVKLSEEYGSKGVEVIGLSTEDPRQSEPMVREFVRDFNIKYKLGWVKKDTALKIARGKNAIPQTFVIGPGGRVFAHISGYSPDVSNMLAQAIDRAKASSANGD